MQFKAVKSGRWLDPATWDKATCPGMKDQVEIPEGITVDINASGIPTNNLITLLKEALLDIYGTLTISASLSYGSKGSSCVLNIQTDVTVHDKGILNLTVTNYPTKIFYGIILDGNQSSCKFTNNGVINITAETNTGNWALTHGILIDDNCTFINNGNINILKTDKGETGNKHCYGLYVRSGLLVNNPSASINTTSNVYGSIRIGSIDTTPHSQGTLKNLGTIQNYGEIWNSVGQILNEGTLEHIFPNSIYTNSPSGQFRQSEDGVVALLGIQTQVISLDELPYGVKGYGISKGKTLSLRNNLTIPNGYSFNCSGKLEDNASVKNEGTLKFTFPSASYNGNTIQGNGKIALEGTISGKSSEVLKVDLENFGGNAYSILLNETLQVGPYAELTIPKTYSLNINHWGTLSIQGDLQNKSAGQVFNYGSITQHGFTENNGALFFYLPSASYTPGTDPVSGNGDIFIGGTITHDLSLDTFGAKNILELITNPLTVNSGATLTIPIGYSLEVIDLNNYGSIENNGTIVNRGQIKYFFPKASYNGTGQVMEGFIALSGTISENANLDDFKGINTRFAINQNDALTINIPDSGSLTLPESTELDVTGTINLNQGLFINEGVINNQAGSFKVTPHSASIVHTFPKSQYSGNPVANSISGSQSVALVVFNGTTGNTLDLSSVGYGVDYYKVRSEDQLTIGENLTEVGIKIPSDHTLEVSGSLDVNNKDINNEGTLKLELEGVNIQNQTSETYSGTGAVAIKGIITTDNFDFVNLKNMFGISSYGILEMDQLSFSCDNINIPSGFAFGNEGMIEIRSNCTFTLNDPPETGALAVIFNAPGGRIFNDGTLKINNSKVCGIYNNTGSEFHNSMGAIIKVNNTAGVGLRFYKIESGGFSNGGLIYILQEGPENLTRESAAISNSGTMKNKGTDDGTIIVPESGKPPIYNSGTLCSGTLGYDGPDDQVINKPEAASPNEWSENCSS